MVQEGKKKSGVKTEHVSLVTGGGKGIKGRGRPINEEKVSIKQVWSWHGAVLRISAKKKKEKRKKDLLGLRGGEKGTRMEMPGVIEVEQIRAGVFCNGGHVSTVLAESREGKPGPPTHPQRRH